jgi:5,10-methylenetetrahydrofolate reductase
MLPPGFSSAILHGMKRQGFDEEALANMTGLSPARLVSVLAGKQGLTDRQLDAIEAAAEITGGELAAMHLEPHGGSFTELAAILGECRSRPLGRQRQTSKRAG